MAQPHLVQVQYSVPRERGAWELSEETMPESIAHDEAVTLLKALLDLWAERAGSALVARNLAIRWVEARPGVGVDPDVSVFSPPPPSTTDLRSIKTWLAGHAPPKIAVEVVSETNATKDYSAAPDKYAASGTGELWVFDPLLAGPTAHGGPFRLQLWERQDDRLVRTYAGDGPAFSPTLRAHLVVTDGGRKLRLADDAAGARLWPTSAEAERAAKDAERAAKDAERAAKDAERLAKEEALERIAALEAELRARKS